jgi:hypothetical protein
MKAMKSGGSKVMTKGALLKLIATENEMKTKECSNILSSLVTVATKEGAQDVGAFLCLHFILSSDQLQQGTLCHHL